MHTGIKSLTHHLILNPPPQSLTHHLILDPPPKSLTHHLIHQGKLYEFQNGGRVDGDTGMGTLVFTVLEDNTVWRVKWAQTGIMSTYFIGTFLMSAYCIGILHRYIPGATLNLKLTPGA